MANLQTSASVLDNNLVCNALGVPGAQDKLYPVAGLAPESAWKGGSGLSWATLMPAFQESIFSPVKPILIF